MAPLNIGVFDSGVGGKLLEARIQSALPNSRTKFIADSKYFPYGNKSAKLIAERARHLTKKLIKHGSRLIVVACNSITTNTISQLRKLYPQVAFVGIEPPIKPIAKLTKSGQVVIIASTATIKSARFAQLKHKLAQNLKLFSVGCPGLAKAIEFTVRHRRPQSYLQISKSEKDFSQQLRKFLNQPIKQGADVVGIGCTHYPYLLAQMKQLYPQVIFYDPAPAVVARVKKIAFTL